MPLLHGRDHGGDCLSTKEVTQPDIGRYESGGSNSLKAVPVRIPVCAIGAPAPSENDIYRERTKVHNNLNLCERAAKTRMPTVKPPQMPTKRPAHHSNQSQNPR